MKTLTPITNTDSIFFTADLHFGHANIIKFCQRPYLNVTHMNEELIKNWNAVVKPTDTVFFLGDFSLRASKTMVRRILENLNGHIYFLPGNHDHNLADLESLPNVTVLPDVTMLDVFDTKRRAKKTVSFVLSHLPLKSWPGMRKDKSINLHGHIHSKPTSRILNLFRKKNQYDVGVDNNNYAPISYKQLKNILKIA